MNASMVASTDLAASRSSRFEAEMRRSGASPDTGHLGLLGLPLFEDLPSSARVLGQGEGEEEWVGRR